MKEPEVVYKRVSPAQVGLGEKLILNLDRRGIHTRGGNGPVRKRLPRQGVADDLRKLRKIAAAHLQTRNAALEIGSRRNLQVEIRYVEERLVLDDGTGQGELSAVLLVGGLDVIKEIPGIERRVEKREIRFTVNVVVAPLRDHIV